MQLARATLSVVFKRGLSFSLNTWIRWASRASLLAGVVGPTSQGANSGSAESSGLVSWVAFFLAVIFFCSTKSPARLLMRAMRKGCSEWVDTSVVRLKLPYFVPTGITMEFMVVFITPTLTCPSLSHLVTTFKKGCKSWRSEKWTLPVTTPSPELMVPSSTAEARTVNLVSLNAGTVTFSKT